MLWNEHWRAGSNATVSRGVVMVRSERLIEEVMKGDKNIYPVPLNHCSSQERPFSLTCEALQPYPVMQAKVKKTKGHLAQAGTGAGQGQFLLQKLLT